MAVGLDDSDCEKIYNNLRDNSQKSEAYDLSSRSPDPHNFWDNGIVERLKLLFSMWGGTVSKVQLNRFLEAIIGHG